MTSEVHELVSSQTISLAVELLDLLLEVGPTLLGLVDDTEVVLRVAGEGLRRVGEVLVRLEQKEGGNDDERRL